MTYKYLGLSLKEIKAVINEADFDALQALKSQAARLAEQAGKIAEAAKLLGYLASQIEAKQPINWESTTTIINILEMKSMSEKQQAGEATGSDLGKKVSYEDRYNPNLLYPIPRIGKREEIGVDSDNLPFNGFDCWNHYEVSWLNAKGKPEVAIAEIYYDCRSPRIIESKSMKLYFNSLNNTVFDSLEKVQETIAKDIGQAIEFETTVLVKRLRDHAILQLTAGLVGDNIDDLDIECSDYLVKPDYLSVGDEAVTETLCSDLLKSNCLVTGQPDWGSVQIHYTGKCINRESLLKYIVSFRNHNEFHEQCIERIFVDIMQYCQPSKLTVYGRYTRRGGLDINPYRSTEESNFLDKNQRLVRQ